MEPHFPKLFTVEEANALLPELKEFLELVATHRDSMREKAPHMEPIIASSLSNGGGKIGSEYGIEAYRLYADIEKVRETGVVLKDLDMGLLDYPHERDGRVVFLCWHPPEERVEYWHEIDAGYAGRQPI